MNNKVIKVAIWSCIIFISYLSIVSAISINTRVASLEDKISQLQSKVEFLIENQDNILEIQLYTYFLFSELCPVDVEQEQEQEEIDNKQSIPEEIVYIDFDVSSGPVFDNKDNHSVKSEEKQKKDTFSVTSIKEPFNFVSACYSKCMMWSLGDRKRCINSCLPI